MHHLHDPLLVSQSRYRNIRSIRTTTIGQLLHYRIVGKTEDAPRFVPFRDCLFEVSSPQDRVIEARMRGVVERPPIRVRYGVWMRVCFSPRLAGVYSRTMVVIDRQLDLVSAPCSLLARSHPYRASPVQIQAQVQVVSFSSLPCFGKIRCE
jgi:hypothetical protein